MRGSKQQFNLNGYITVPQLISSIDADRILVDLLKTIKKCAEDIGVTEESYLKVISRWQNPSVLTDCVPHNVIQSVQLRLENIYGEPFQVNRWNIIIKNQFSYGAIPCHQDIAYSQSNPYYLSTWIPLTSLPKDSGGLKVLPKSHLDPIQPAVDFWSPDFIDHMCNSKKWKKKAISFVLNPGDSIIFHSRLWHGSDKNILRTNRYSLVIRWKTESFLCPEIPMFPAERFGMHTCGKVTETLLRDGMNSLNINSDHMSRNEVILWWVHNLEKLPSVDVKIDRLKAINALVDLSILDRASLFHNGGDSEGRVYKTLWNTFLNNFHSSEQYA